MIRTTLLLLPLFHAPQETPDGWQPVDGVVGQAGDAVITRSEVVRHANRLIDAGIVTPTTVEDYQVVHRRALEALVILTLESQAGEDREERPQEVEGRIDRYLASRRQEGLNDYVQGLEDRGISAHRQREETKSGFYTSVFRDLGLGGERPSRDSYVRPGELRFLHRIETLAGLRPDGFRFRELVLAVAATGTVEETRTLAEELRAQLVAGADFAPLHAANGASQRETGGLTPLIGLADLAQRIRPVAEWALEADVGDVSPVVPLGADGIEPNAFGIWILEEEVGMKAPRPFRSAEVQAELRGKAVDQRADLWLGLARSELRRKAYLWPRAGDVPGDPAEEAAEGPGGAQEGSQTTDSTSEPPPR